MSKSIPQNALVVVADGHQAILYRAEGVGDDLSVREEQRLSPKNLSDEGPSGSRPEDQTPRQTDEATFAKQLAEALYAMNKAGKFEHMVLAADPQTLGQLRNAMSKELAATIVFTLDKELTNHAANDLGGILRKAAS